MLEKKSHCWKVTLSGANGTNSTCLFNLYLSLSQTPAISVMCTPIVINTRRDNTATTLKTAPCSLLIVYGLACHNSRDNWHSAVMAQVMVSMETNSFITKHRA